MNPTGAIPFADIKDGETLWACEHGRRMEWVPPMIFRHNGYKPGEGE